MKSTNMQKGVLVTREAHLALLDMNAPQWLTLRISTDRVVTRFNINSGD
jgi:hypothetical protein